MVLSAKRCTVEDFCNRLHKTLIKQFKWVAQHPVDGGGGSTTACVTSMFLCTCARLGAEVPQGSLQAARACWQSLYHGELPGQCCMSWGVSHAVLCCAALRRYALVWGSSVKHRPQKVGKDHLLHDEDIVQIVKKI